MSAYYFIFIFKLCQHMALFWTPCLNENVSLQRRSLPGSVPACAVDGGEGGPPRTCAGVFLLPVTRIAVWTSHGRRAPEVIARARELSQDGLVREHQGTVTRARSAVPTSPLSADSLVCGHILISTEGSPPKRGHSCFVNLGIWHFVKWTV